MTKIEMVTRCRGVGWEEVGLKCCCIQGCCEGVKSGVRSWETVVKVATSTKTNQVVAVALQS